MIAKITTLLVAVLHLVFMVVETFLWTTPAIRERFGQSVEQAEATRVLAANQGVYNGALGIGTLAASLIFGAIWTRISPHAAFLTGASLAVVASLLLFTVVSGRGRDAAGSLSG